MQPRDPLCTGWIAFASGLIVVDCGLWIFCFFGSGYCCVSREVSANQISCHISDALSAFRPRRRQGVSLVSECVCLAHLGGVVAETLQYTQGGLCASNLTLRFLRRARHGDGTGKLSCSRTDFVHTHLPCTWYRVLDSAKLFLFAGARSFCLRV